MIILVEATNTDDCDGAVHSECWCQDRCYSGCGCEGNHCCDYVEGS